MFYTHNSLLKVYIPLGLLGWAQRFLQSSVPTSWRKSSASQALSASAEGHVSQNPDSYKSKLQNSPMAQIEVFEHSTFSFPKWKEIKSVMKWKTDRVISWG